MYFHTIFVLLLLKIKIKQIPTSSLSISDSTGSLLLKCVEQVLYVAYRLKDGAGNVLTMYTEERHQHTRLSYRRLGLMILTI